MANRVAFRNQPVDHLSEPPPPEDVPFDEAFGVLSPQAFSLWIRLHAEPQAELNKGRRAVADRIGIASRTFDRWIGELRNAGFVEVIAQTAPGNSAIQLLRRAAIVGASHFVVLHRALEPAPVDPAWDYGFPASGRTAADVRAARRAAARPFALRPKIRRRARAQRTEGERPEWVGLAAAMRDKTSQGRRKAGQPERVSEGESPSPQRAKGDNDSLDNRVEDWARKQASRPKASPPAADRGSSQPLRGLSTKKKLKSEERPVDLGSTPELRLRRAEERFEGARAEELRAVLVDEGRGRAQDSAQRRARREAGTAFVEVYAVLRRSGFQSDYRRPRVDDRAVKAGVGCLLAGVTPRALIDYWAERVPDFTSMGFPSIAFLASDRNIDEAKLATLPKKKRGGLGRTRTRFAAKSVDEHHAFTADKLHPDFEAHLVSKGLVEVGELKLNRLLRLQSVARSVILEFIDPPTDPLEQAAVEFFRALGGAR